MTRWAPERRDVLAAVADELLQHHPGGQVLVGIDGADEGVAAGIAEGLAEAIRASGRDAATAVVSPGLDAQAVRTDVVAAFRADAGPDAVLLAHGSGLVGDDLRGMWHVTLQLVAERSRADANSPASALLDVADPEHPRRIFADAC